MPPELLPPDEPPRPPREPPRFDPVREPLPRELVLRDLPALARPLDALEREALPADLAAPPLLRAVDFAPDERLDPEAADFARVEVALLAAPLLLERALVPLLFALVERAPPEEARALLDRPEVLREEVDRVDEPVLAPPLPLELSPVDHLPDITRCAASATASAMIEPSLVALETTLLAARSAVSAASRPASRIFLRAAGLALIAAAAAASPAASISLLIAAFANLSMVSLLEPERDELDPERDDEERDELLRADFAIIYLPRSGTRHLNAVPVPE